MTPSTMRWTRKCRVGSGPNRVTSAVAHVVAADSATGGRRLKCGAGERVDGGQEQLHRVLAPLGGDLGHQSGARGSDLLVRARGPDLRHDLGLLEMQVGQVTGD